MNAIAPAFGCTNGGISFGDALARVLALVEAPLKLEQVPLADCVGRVLAEPFHARLDSPRFNQSAMDGYAVCAADLMPGGWLPVSGRTAAGDAVCPLEPGGAHRILTGAPVPIGADAVIAQENVHRDGDVIRIASVVPPGANVRRRGEDILVGCELITAGTTLDWRHLTVLAAQGVCDVLVRSRPTVALLSSGKELRGLGENLGSGQIHDSNMPMLTALLTNWGAVVRPMPMVDDDAASMRAALRSAAESADLVLTTAGISVGDEDHVRDALCQLGGDLAVLKVAMKPGKPLSAGRFGNAVFVGLPGNPIAALAGAVGFVRPLLARMMRTPAAKPVQAHAAFDLRRKPGRAELIPVRLAKRNEYIWAERAGPDGSGRLAPLLSATGFAFIPEYAANIRSGDPVEFMAFIAGGAP